MCHIFAQALAQAHAKLIMLFFYLLYACECAMCSCLRFVCYTVLLPQLLCYCMLPRDIQEINHCIETVMAFYVWIWDFM